MHSITVLEKDLLIRFPSGFGEKMDDISKKINSGDQLVLNTEMGAISVLNVLDFDSEKEASIFQIYTEFRDLMKDGTVPIINVGYDDYICLYFVGRTLPPKIILWCYERALESVDYAMFPLTDTFEEFVEKLNV